MFPVNSSVPSSSSLTRAKPSLFLTLDPEGLPDQERSPLAGNAKSGEARLREYKEQLVKAARMYAMCQKAEIDGPLKVTGLAVAAFETYPSNRPSCLFGPTNST